jgi:hypothetical protein
LFILSFRRRIVRRLGLLRQKQELFKTAGLKLKLQLSFYLFRQWRILQRANNFAGAGSVLPLTAAALRQASGAAHKKNGQPVFRFREKT